MPSQVRIPLKPLLAFLLPPLLLTLACAAPPFISYTGGSSSGRDGSRANIRIVSAVARTPGGACTPPRENVDFICKYQLRWEIEYWVPEPATLDCVIYRDGEQVTFYGEGVEAGEGTWEYDLLISNFYESMGVYTEKVVCSAHEGNREGERWASDEKSYDVSLTTTWE
jgi:hypothetical protein